MKTNSVAIITQAEELSMGHTVVKQPLPTQRLQNVDPFLLLHHFGPYDVAPGVDPLDVGPHPHRGFEPVTFLLKGGIRHRDSRDNTGHLQGGDVQWMTAGRGIIHSERASKDFLAQGGTMEGIQLWINLPAQHKMTTPGYQDIKKDQIPTWYSPDQLAEVHVVAGAFHHLKGPATTFTPIAAYTIDLQQNGSVDLPISEGHNALIYIINGEVQLNGTWSYGAGNLVSFKQDGEGITLLGQDTHTKILFLSGQPIEEPVTQYGPFVMNTQTEIMQAMRDYQMGKMGFYIEE